MSTHQQSKPRCANQSITEESGRPGTLKSKVGWEAIDEPWTNSTIGLPAVDPACFCQRKRRTSPSGVFLCVQCSTPLTLLDALVSFMTVSPMAEWIRLYDRRCEFIGTLRRSVERCLQFRDVELHHLQHGVASALDLGRVGIGHHLGPDLGDDLPRHAVAVLEPAAGFRLAAVEQRIPVAVDLGLIVTAHHERDRMVERIKRPGAHG